MCKAQWELQEWDLFTIPLSSFLSKQQQQQQKPKTKTKQLSRAFLAILFSIHFVEMLGLRGRKVISLEILRAVISTSWGWHCQFTFSEWVISMCLHSAQYCSALHILYTQWGLVNWFCTSMWQHKYIMKNEVSGHRQSQDSFSKKKNTLV